MVYDTYIILHIQLYTLQLWKSWGLFLGDFHGHGSTLRAGWLRKGKSHGMMVPGYRGRKPPCVQPTNITFEPPKIPSYIRCDSAPFGSLRVPSGPGCRALAGTGTAATTGATAGLAAEKLAPRQGWFNGWGQNGDFTAQNMEISWGKKYGDFMGKTR